MAKFEKLSARWEFLWQQGLSEAPAVRQGLAVGIWERKQTPSLELAAWVAPGPPHGDSDEACH